MTNILKNFSNAEGGTGIVTDANTGEQKESTAAAEKNAMRSLLEGLDAQQKSVNQMPSTHTMAKNTDTKHPASNFLVGGEEGEPEAGKEVVDELEKINVGESAVTEGGLRAIKVTFDTGEEMSTNMAAGLSDEQMLDYYAVGKRFNLGDGAGGDRMATVAHAEILEDTVTQPEAPRTEMNKKQSLADLFRSMDETEEDKATQFKKELHDERKARELSKGDNGKFNLAEEPINEGMSTSNFDSMADDMKRLMSQGKTIKLVAKESHVSDKYKGDIFDYQLTIEDGE